MTAVVVVGAQWGDEGKGKVVDIFTEFADVVVRYAGGPNAGHTLVVGTEKVVVRLLPSGVLRPDKRCLLGQGMVIDPTSLVEELDELRDRSIRPGPIVVSDRAHTILPYHVLMDGLREQGPTAIGTTKRGVGPCYEDKAARRGITLGMLRSLSQTRERVESALSAWAPVFAALGGVCPDAGDVMAKLAPLAERIVPMLGDTSKLVNDALARGERVLFEGAQGTLLDVDHGTYPFVTSSNSTAGGACTGAGVGPSRIDTVIGLTKAYCTRVGGGPFPTELQDDLGERIRRIGGEFGAVTGRPRRTGWLDLPALRYAVRVNGLDGFALTKLDVLTGIDTIKACVRYRTHGVETEDFPVDDPNAEPIYAELPGWREDLRNARKLEDLPDTVRRYVRFIEEQTSCPVTLVSVGQRRDETIVLKQPFAR